MILPRLYVLWTLILYLRLLAEVALAPWTVLAAKIGSVSELPSDTSTIFVYVCTVEVSRHRVAIRHRDEPQLLQSYVC